MTEGDVPAGPAFSKLTEFLSVTFNSSTILPASVPKTTNLTIQSCIHSSRGGSIHALITTHAQPAHLPYSYIPETQNPNHRCDMRYRAHPTQVCIHLVRRNCTFVPYRRLKVSRWRLPTCSTNVQLMSLSTQRNRRHFQEMEPNQQHL